MSTSSLDKMFEIIFSDTPDLSVVRECGADMTGAELVETLSLIREKALEASGVETVRSLAGVVANLLLGAALYNSFPEKTDATVRNSVSRIAGAAAEMFDLDVGDQALAQVARLAEAILSLEPAALADVYDLFGQGLGEDARIRLLRLLAGCGDADYNRRYGPALGEALSARRARLAAEADRTDVTPTEGGEPVSPDGLAESAFDVGDAVASSNADDQAPLDDDGNSITAVTHPESDDPAERQQTLQLEPAGQEVVQGVFVDTVADGIAVDGDAPVAATDELADLAAFEADLTRSPKDRDLRAAYIRMAIDLGSVERAVSFLARIATGLHDSDKAAALIDLATLHLDGTGDSDAAMTALESALDADRSGREALQRYADLAVASELAERGAVFLETVRRALTGTPSEIPLLTHLGRLLGLLGRDDEAEKLWRRLRALDPRNLEALEFYIGYYGRKSDWQKQFATAQFELSVVDGDGDRIRLNLLMADVAENRLNNLDRAAEAHKRILQLSPENVDSFEALVCLFEKSRKWHQLVEMYNDRIRRLPLEDVDQKVALLFRIVEIYQNPEKQPSQENMLAAYSRIADISPTNVQALDTLDRGYQTSERWPDLLKVLEKKIELTEDPVELLELFNRVAEIVINRMSNETQAIPFLEKILELDPENLDVVLKLKSIYSHKHNQEKHYAMLKREIAMVQGAERERILLSAAEMARDKLLLFEEALELYSQAYRQNGTLREARENMHALFDRMERWSDYALFLDSEVECEMPDRRRIELLHKLAEIRSVHLGDPAGAETVYQKILSIDPSDDLATDRLEAMLLQQGRFQEIYDVYRKMDDVRKFVAQITSFDAQKGVSPSYRKEMCLILARACEIDLKEPERALEFMEQAFQADPADDSVGRKVLATAMKKKDFKRAERVLKILTATASEPTARQEDFVKLSKLYSETGRPSDAFDALADGIKADLESDSLQKLVAEAIDSGTSAELWQPLAGLLADVVTAPAEDAWRQQILMVLGRIQAERLLFHEDARTTFEKVLAIDPGALEALDALEAIAMQQQDFTALECVLTRRIDALDGDVERQAVLLRLGALYEDLIGDDEKAADAFARAAELAAEPDRVVLSGLHRTYDRLERFPELADVIRKERLLATQDWERTALDIELAGVLADGLGQFDDALAVLDGILCDADNDKAMALVRRIFDEDFDTDTAGSILRTVYSRVGDSAGLLGVVETMINRSTRNDVKAALLVQAAGILSADLGDPAGAFSRLASSIRLFPTEENVRLALGLAQDVDGFRALAEAIQAVAEPELPTGDDFPELDPEIQALLFGTLGNLYGRKLGQPRKAVLAMERVMALADVDEPFLTEMLTLYRAVDDIDSALEAFDRLQAVQAPDDSRHTMIEKAMYAAANGRIDTAVAALRDVAGRAFDTEADSLLEEMLLEHGRYGDLIELLQVKLERPGYADSRAETCFRIAGVFRTQMKMASEAARFVRQAIVESSGRADIVAFAVELVLDRSVPDRKSFAPELAETLIESLQGQPDGAGTVADLLRVTAEFCEDPLQRVAILNRLAELQDMTGDHVGRFDTLSQALANTPGDAELAAAFVASAIRAGAGVRAVERLGRFAASVTGPDRIRLSMAAAELAKDHVGDEPGAVAIYRTLLVEHPDNVQVIQALETLLQKMGNDADRVPLLERLAVLEDDLSRRRTIRLKAAILASSSGDPLTASGFLKFVVDARPDENALDPESEQAARSLIDVSVDLDDFDTVAEMHLLLGRLLPDVNERRSSLLAAAEVSRDRLGHPADALNIFTGLLKVDESDVVARDAARELARKIDNVRVLMDILRYDVATADDSSRRNAALLEWATISLRIDVNDTDGAIETLRRVLQDDPSNAAAIKLVESIYDDSEAAPAAARLLIDAAQRSGDGELLVRTLRVAIGQTGEPAERAAMLKTVGMTLVRLERNAEAVEAFADAFLEMPSEPETLQDLFDQLVRQQRPELLSERVDAACDLMPDDAVDAVIDLRLRAAALLNQVPGKSEDAFVILRRALAIRESDPAVIRAIIDLTQDAGMWLHYVEIQRLNIAYILSSPDEKADAWLECGAIYADADRLNDQDLAAECYREVLAIRPLDRAALDVLARILGAAGDKEGLRILWQCELAAWEGLPSDQRDEGRMTRLRISVAEGALESGVLADAVAAATAIIESRAADAHSLDVTVKIYRETLDLELFNKLTSLLADRNEHRRLLDLYRFVYSRKDVPPGPEVCLRKSIELDEKLRLHDFRFEDLGRLVELVPTDAANMATYIEVGRKLGRMAKVAALLEKTLAAFQDREVAFEVAMQLAEIYESDLKKPEDATNYLRLAFLRRPEDRGVVERLAAAYVGLEQYGDLALLFENLGDLTVDASERIEHYFKAAKVQRDNVGSPDGAIEILKKIMDIDPSNMAAIDALEQVSRQTENFPELAVWLQHRADVTTDEGIRRALLLELSDLMATRLGRPGDAASVLEALQEALPQDLEVWGRLEKALLALGAFDRLADMYMRLAGVVLIDEHRLAALKKAASVFEARLNDRFQAVHALEEILNIDPRDSFACVRLGEMLEADEDWPALARHLAGCCDASQDSQARAGLALRVADLYMSRLDRRGDAVGYFKIALDFDPSIPEAREGLMSLVGEGDWSVDAAMILEDVFSRTGESDRLLDVLRRQLVTLHTGSERAAILMRMAEVQAVQPGMTGEAVSLVGQALAEAPGKADVLARLQAMAESAGLWQQAYDLVAAALANAADDEALARLHRFAGTVAASRLDDFERAAGHLETFLSLQGPDAEVLESLDAIYGRMGRRADQAAILRQRISLAGDDAGSALQLRLAAALMDDSRDVDTAFEIARKVLKKEPANQDALKFITDITSDPIVGRRAMDVLRRAFRESRNDSELLRAVENQILNSHESAELIELHCEAAGAAGSLGNSELQLVHLGAALALDPSSEDVLMDVLETAGRNGNGKLAWAILKRAAQAASWPDLEKKLLLDSVALAGQTGFEDQGQIEAALRRVLEIDPANRTALDALDATFKDTGRQADLIAMLRHKLRLNLTQDERVATLLRLGGMLEGTGELKQAAEAFEEAVVLEPGDLNLLNRLRAIYTNLGDVKGQIDTIERVSIAAKAPKARISGLLEVALLQREQLGDLKAAMATLERVIADDPGNLTGRQRLEDVYEDVGDFQALVRLLSNVLDSKADATEKVRCAMKAAQVSEIELDNVPMAISLVRRAWAIDPENREVIDDLMRLYFKTEDWTSLIGVVRARAAIETDEAARMQALVTAVQIAVEQVGDQGLAAIISREILQIRPDHHESILLLARMAESRQHDAEALELFKQLAGDSVPPKFRIDGLLGTARMLTRAGAEGDLAADYIRQAAGLDPEHPAVRQFLKASYLENGDYSRLAECLDRELAAAATDEERAAVSMDMAEIYLNRLSDGDKFLEYAMKAYGYRRDDPRTVTALVDYFLKNGRDSEAVPYLEWLINYLEAKRLLKELPPYAHALGRILEASGDGRRAVDFYRICHEHDAANIDNALALGRLHIRHNDMEKALRVMQPMLLRIDSLPGDQKREILLSLARINENRGDLKKARQFVNRLLTEQPDCADAREMLSRL